MADAALFLANSPFSAVSCKIHPVVIWSILNQYLRRGEGQQRIIGTLLGINFDGLIEIRSCFTVPHAETDQVAVDTEFHKNMLDLHLKAHPKEVIVGWFSTGAEIDADTLLIHHEFYEQEAPAPLVHLTVETDMKKAFVSSNVSLGETPVATQFLPVQLEMVTFEAEKIGVETLMRSRSANRNASQPLLPELQSLEISVAKLLNMLEDVTAYVEKVLSGEVPADPKIGRFLADTVHSLPKIESASFEKMFNSGLQDLLMAVYLANLTRTQLVLSEKLQTVV